MAQETRTESREESVGVEGSTTAVDFAIQFLRQSFDSQFQAGYTFVITETNYQPDAGNPQKVIVTATATGTLLTAGTSTQAPTTAPTAAPTATTSSTTDSQVTDQQIQKNVDKELQQKNPVNLIFDLETEINIDLLELPIYIGKLNQIFQFYKEQLINEKNEIKNYDLSQEMDGLSSFLTQLEAAILATDKVRPVIADDREKLSISNYRYMTLKISPETANIQSTPPPPADLTQANTNPDIASSPAALEQAVDIGSPAVFEKRKFSDGSERDVRIYNKIDSVFLTTESPNSIAQDVFFGGTETSVTQRISDIGARRVGEANAVDPSRPVTSEPPTSSNISLRTMVPIEANVFGISPSTLALIFNIKKIVDQQMNALVPNWLMLCKGSETALAKLQANGFSISGNNIIKSSTKVLVQDFLNAYIHPIKEIQSRPAPDPSSIRCTPQNRRDLFIAKNAVKLYNFKQRTVESITGSPRSYFDLSTNEKKEYEEYIKNKKFIAEMAKKCPDVLDNQPNLFEDLRSLKELGQIFDHFINKFNIPCLVDEALRCVMPQISCEEILRDISPDNVEQRLNAAFPHAKNVTRLIVKKIGEEFEKIDREREERGEPPLNAEEGTRKALEIVKAFIDIEALCKLDIQALGEALNALLSGIDFSLLINLFDWQFDMMMALDDAIIKLLIEAIKQLIDQILNALIGCDALDATIASVFGGDIDVSPGLFGDIAGLFRGDFDFSNTTDILNQSMQSFLSESSDEFSKIIKFQSTAYNPVFNTTFNSFGNFGYNPAQGQIAGATQTEVDAFGGLINFNYEQSNVGGLPQNNFENTTFTFDFEKLGTNEGSKQFLREIGKFENSTRNGENTVARISDDSYVDLQQGLKETSQFFASTGRAIGGAVSGAVMSAAAAIANAPATPLATAGGDLNASSGNQTSQALTVDNLSADRESRRSASTMGDRQEKDIFVINGIRNKNRVILDAVLELNRREQTSTIMMRQKDLTQQIKEFVSTCFNLLSPSETIDLITGNASREVLLTIQGISRIRFPALYMIMQTPEVHGNLFATFGRITKLDSIAPRLQILNSDPKLKKIFMSKDVCAPFGDTYGFRKELMKNTLPADLANKLMDDLIEEDRKNYNNLVDTLSKGFQPKFLDNPNVFSANKTFDGKQIEEVDNSIDGIVSNMFNQIKKSFNKELKMLPEALSTTVEVPRDVKKFIFKSAKPLSGFNTPQGEKKTINFEFKQIDDSYHEFVNGSRERMRNAPAPQGPEDNPYYRIPDSKKVAGEFFKKIFENTIIKRVEPNQPTDLNLPRTELEMRINGSLSGSDKQSSALEKFKKPADLTPEQLSRISAGDFSQLFKQETSGFTPPKWSFTYLEKTDGTYKFSLRTAGNIIFTRGSEVKYTQKFETSGSLEKTPGINREISSLFGTDSSDYSRRDTFRTIMEEKIKNIILTPTPGQYRQVRMEIDTLIDEDLNYIFDSLLASDFSDLVQKYLKSTLLQQTKTSDFDSELQTIMLNLIDFTPQPTEYQVRNKIDNHLLQLEVIKKRVKDQYNNTFPENIRNSNSRINTRYKDNKPGHLSDKIMTGLAEIYFRTSVLEGIFKGLFVFDIHRYSLTEFGLNEIIYTFFENIVRKDIQNTPLRQQLEIEIDRVYDIYKKQNPPLVDDESNKLKSLVKYYLKDSLAVIAKLLGKCPDQDQASTSQNTQERTDINTDELEISRRKQFLNSLKIQEVYTNYYKYRTKFVNVRYATRSRGDEGAAAIGVKARIKVSGFIPNEIYSSNTWDWAQGEWADRNLYKGRYGLDPIFILEKFVELEFQDHEWYSRFTLSSDRLTPDQLKVKEYFPSLKGTTSNDKVILTFKNYEEFRDNFLLIMGAAFSEYQTRNANSEYYIYNPNKPEYSFLKSPPKYGMRLSLLKPTLSALENSSENIEIQKESGFIDKYQFGSPVSVATSNSRQTILSLDYINRSNSEDKLEENVALKRGLIQPMTERLVEVIETGLGSEVDDIRNPALNQNVEKLQVISYRNDRGEVLEANEVGAGAIKDLRNQAIQEFKNDNPGAVVLTSAQKKLTVIPIITKYSEMTEDMYNFEVATTRSENLLPCWFDFSEERNNHINILKKKIEDDPILDLLVNYCLLSGVQNTFALINSIVGSANEDLAKLFEGTKEIILENYNAHLNSGNFKGKGVLNKQRGPSFADMAKAAVTMPIGILKGLSTTIDPNIFLADKIVQMGKMGFIVPKYKVVKAGEKYRVKNSDEMREIQTDGVATKGYFEHDTTGGEYLILENPTDDQTPLTEFTPVALVETVDNKTRIKRPDDLQQNPENKYIIKQGLGFSGVPMKRDGNSFTPLNTDLSSEDEEDLSTFDLGLSAPVYPGEQVNIPYSVASLILAPFPIFGPSSLTTYNIAYPFGPLFLALEPLIYENVTINAGIPKKKKSIADTANNFDSCKVIVPDSQEEIQRQISILYSSMVSRITTAVVNMTHDLSPTELQNIAMGTFSILTNRIQNIVMPEFNNFNNNPIVVQNNTKLKQPTDVKLAQLARKIARLKQENRLSAESIAITTRNLFI